MPLTLSDLDFTNLINSFPEINNFDFSKLSKDENALSEFIKICEGKIIFEEDLNNFIKFMNLNIGIETDQFLIDLFKYVLIAFIFTNLIDQKTLNQVRKFDEFQKEFNERIEKLEKDLSKKHPIYREFIEFKFNTLKNAEQNQINEFSEIVQKVNDSKILENENKKGRPNNLIFDNLLLRLDDYSSELKIADKYSKIIIPFFTFIATNYPDFVDIHDITHDKLRKRLEYLKSNKQTGE